MNPTDLQETLQTYARPDRRRAILQILDTLLPYLALYALMIVLVREGFSYWLVLAVAVPTAAFYVRVFILFHDCCHGSFFASRKANRILGYVTGILTFTPFEQWRRSHARHHETVGDLDRRGVGDIWTLTVEEYRAAPRGKRILYRIIRNPFAILLLGPPIVFLIGQRYFHKDDRTPERRSVVITDLAIAAIVVVAGLTIGLGTYFMVQLPITMIAGGAGLWLFYVQHQFKGVYWARHEDWDRNRAAMEGSSFYRLPVDPAVVHGEHRVSPRPSRAAADPELRSRTLPSEHACAAGGHSHDASRQLQMRSATSVGRGKAGTDGVSRVEELRSAATAGGRTAVSTATKHKTPPCGRGFA